MRWGSTAKPTTGLPSTTRVRDSGTTKYQGVAGLGTIMRDQPGARTLLDSRAFYGVGVGHMATTFDSDTFASMVKEFDASGARHPLCLDRHHDKRRASVTCCADGELKDRIMKKLVLSRRRLLRGAAYGVGARSRSSGPRCDVEPRTATRSPPTAHRCPSDSVEFYWGNGVVQNQWFPTQAGATWSLSPGSCPSPR